MKWSYKLGTFLGIDVRLHLTFLLLLGWVGLSALLDTGSLAAVLAHTLFVVALFAFVVMHEYGHALTARVFGVQTRRITLYPIGGVAMLERMPESPRAQLLIALAGPAVNFVLAGLIAVLSALIAPAGSQLLSFASAELSLLSALFWVNVLMGGFNLLPALPMDGGRVLRAFLAMRMEPARATKIAARAAKVVAVAMAVFALLQTPTQLSLLAIAVLVWVLSSVEDRAASFAARDESPDAPIRVRAYPVGPSAGESAKPDLGAAPATWFGEAEVALVRGPDGILRRVVRVRR